MRPWWRLLRKKPAPATPILEARKYMVPLCGQMRIFIGDARPKLPADSYECGDKSNPLRKVSSRSDETLTSKALEDSKRGNCNSASNEHVLLNMFELRFPMLEFRFDKFSGICIFSICIESARHLVSQLSGSSHLGNLGLGWLGLRGLA